jgi:hypothetical protein
MGLTAACDSVAQQHWQFEVLHSIIARRQGQFQSPLTPSTGRLESTEDDTLLLLPRLRAIVESIQIGGPVADDL